MFKQVYLHRVVVAAQEGLIMPMLKRLAKLSDWNSKLQDPNCSWRELDDSILNQIPRSVASIMTSKPKNERADWCFIQHCWSRVQNRFLPSSKFITEQEAANHKSTELERVVEIKLNLNNGKNDPLKQVQWYNDNEKEKEEEEEEAKTPVQSDRIGPSKYQEIRYLKLNMKQPLVNHYTSAQVDEFEVKEEFPNDMCMHNYWYITNKIMQLHLSQRSVQDIAFTYYSSEISASQLEEGYDIVCKEKPEPNSIIIIVVYKHEASMQLPPLLNKFVSEKRLYIFEKILTYKE
jgi:hypothetical protein